MIVFLSFTYGHRDEIRTIQKTKNLGGNNGCSSFVVTDPVLGKRFELTFVLEGLDPVTDMGESYEIVARSLHLVCPSHKKIENIDGTKTIERNWCLPPWMDLQNTVISVC